MQVACGIILDYIYQYNHANKCLSQVFVSIDPARDTIAQVRTGVQDLAHMK